MSYRKEKGIFPMEGREIGYTFYFPEEPPRAVLQICPDFGESVEEYEENGLIGLLCEREIAVCGSEGEGPIGQEIPENTGAKTESPATKSPTTGSAATGSTETKSTPTEKLHALEGIIRKYYPRLPHILCGVGKGALVALKYVANAQGPDGVLLCGAEEGSMRPLGMAMKIAGITAKIKGERAKSAYLEKKAFPGRKFREEGRPDVKTCREMMKMLAEQAEPEFTEKIPQALPFFLMAGKEDPTCGGGEETKALAERLEEREVTSLKLEIYEGGAGIFEEKEGKRAREEAAEWIKETAEAVAACRSLTGLPYVKGW